MRNKIRNILYEATSFDDRPNINDAFWKWFGDSKVVDDNGNPLICYHGTKNASFKKFKPKDRPLNFWSSLGNWFTPLANLGSDFADVDINMNASNLESLHTRKNNYKKYASGVYPVYLSLKNPIIQHPEDENGIDPMMQIANAMSNFGPPNYPVRNKSFIKELQRKGIDGIIVVDTTWDLGSKNTQYCAFDSNQIKSIYNQGTWNINNKDIMK